MGSTFYGLGIASSGLNASQAALELTGHNIANANNPGYTRQQLVQSSVEPEGNIGMFASSNAHNIGGGTSIDQIKQVRSDFLDVQYRNENQKLGEWETRSDQLSSVQSIFNEPSSSALNSVLDDFYTSLSALSKTPDDPTARSTVQMKGEVLCENINDIYSKLEDTQKELNDQVGVNVENINSIAHEISDIDQQIFKFESSGVDKANDLRDQRNSLIDQLSNMVNVTTNDVGGRFQVYIGGHALVDHDQVSELETVARENQSNSIDSLGLTDVVWKNGNQPLTLSGGSLKGLIDMRDGVGYPVTANAGDVFGNNREQGVPYFMEQLNTFAKAFMTSVNAIHKSGYDFNGDQGKDFFSSADTGSVAKTISLSKDVKEDYNKIAASDSTSAKGNNKNIEKLINARNSGDSSNIPGLSDIDKTFLNNVGNIDNFEKGIISTLGVSTRQSNNMSTNEQTLLNDVDKRRMSYSGVSINEEVTNLVKYQHTFQASAKVMSAMDQMLNTLINQMS